MRRESKAAGVQSNSEGEEQRSADCLLALVTVASFPLRPRRAVARRDNGDA